MTIQSDALNNLARARGIPLGVIPPAPSPSPAIVDRSDLPLIPLPRAGEQMISFAENVGAVVGANGVFRRDSSPVTIDPETGRVEEMDAARFQSYVESHLTPFAWRGNVRQPTTMTLYESRGCLRSDSFVRPLRKLRRVNLVRLPIMRSDGRIELLPLGYDARSSIYTMKDALSFEPDWEFERARLFLSDLLGEFPFAEERSRAVHILAMLAVFGADLVAPDSKRLNFIYRANQPRAGKGLLAATAIVGPHGHVRVQAIPDDAAEFKKILDTEALNGSAYVFLDEINRTLRNRTLNSFLTATIWTGRLMNTQKQFAVPQTSICFMTGNCVELSTDLAGRCLLVDLYVSQADPQDRHIRHVISDSYLVRPEVRADILAALWALVRHWDERQRPRPASSFRGFEAFSNIFGGIVETAGYASPMKSVAAEIDEDFSDMLAVVEKLAEGVTRRAEFDFGAIVEVCRAINAFEWWVSRGDLTPKARSWLGKLFSVRYGGSSFRLADGRHVSFGKRGDNRGRRYTIAVL